MRRRGLSNEEEAEMNLTPMLDIVFIMLIFFIVTASFIKESGIEVDKTEAQTAALVANPTVLIAISADNEIWIQNTDVDPRDVRTTIERLIAENPRGAVVIQPDKESTAATLSRTLEAVSAAGAENVHVSTEEL